MAHVVGHLLRTIQVLLVVAAKAPAHRTLALLTLSCPLGGTASDRPGVFQGDSWWANTVPTTIHPHWVEAGASSAGVPFPQRGAWTALALSTARIRILMKSCDQSPRMLLSSQSLAGLWRTSNRPDRVLMG